MGADGAKVSDLGWNPVLPLLAVGTWARFFISLSLTFHAYKMSHQIIVYGKGKEETKGERSHPSLQIELDGVPETGRWFTETEDWERSTFVGENLNSILNVKFEMPKECLSDFVIKLDYRE